MIPNDDVDVNSKPADDQVETQQVNIVPDSITITEDTDSKGKDTDEITCSKDKDKDRITCVKPVSLELTDGWYLYYNLFMYSETCVNRPPLRPRFTAGIDSGPVYTVSII